MKFFRFFKRRRDDEFPDQYHGLITPEDYQFVLGIVKKYHAEKGLNILSIGKGEIVVEVSGEQQYRYLDNLIRMLPAARKGEWTQTIYEHFDKFKDHRSAYRYLYKDFEYAAQFLRVLIKGEDLYKDELDQLVARSDFPGTNTFLVIEFQELFTYVRRKDIDEWGKSTEELFEIAIGNTPGEEIKAKKALYCDKFTVFVFFSGDFSSALMLDLAARAEFCIGTYGSLIAIPTKGTSFVHPIETPDIMELVEFLAPTINKFYNEDPGNITTNFYWRYGDRIEKFPVGQDDNGQYVRLPQGLIKIFKG
jgi:hypothetical protein